MSNRPDSIGWVPGVDGRRFHIRLVRKGDRYGRDDCRVHKDGIGMGTLVEFYDGKYADAGTFGPLGQFVSRYYISTLNKHPHPHGLCLDGGVAVWRIGPDAMRVAMALINGAERGSDSDISDSSEGGAA